MPLGLGWRKWRGVGTRYSTPGSAGAASRGAITAIVGVQLAGSSRDRNPGPDAAPVSRGARTSSAAECRDRDRGHCRAAARPAQRSLRRHARHERHPCLQCAGVRVHPEDPARRNPHLWRSRRRPPGIGRRALGRAGDFQKPVHDHRALPSRARGRQLCRQDFAERRRHLQAPAAVDRGRARASAARPCSTCCFRLLRRARRAKFAA